MMKVPAVTLKERRVLASNPEAQQELAKGRLISMESASRLSAEDPELDGMISVMCRPDGPQQASCTATAIDGSRFLAQAVRFNRLRGTLMEAAGVDDPALMLVLTPVDDRVAGREAALRAFSSFTPMEGAIAMALVNGQSISDIARDRRVSVPTIRWHIRNMIEKTGENGVRASRASSRCSCHTEPHQMKRPGAISCTGPLSLCWRTDQAARCSATSRRFVAGVFVDALHGSHFARHAGEGGFIELALGVGLLRLTARAVKVADHFGDRNQVARVDLCFVFLCAAAPHRALDARATLQGLQGQATTSRRRQATHTDRRGLAPRERAASSCPCRS